MGRKNRFTVAVAFNAFITECEVYGKSLPTISNYRTSYKLFCRHMPGIDEELIGDITKDTVTQFIGVLRTQGLSTASVNHYIRDIRVFLYWCMENDYVNLFKVKCIKDTSEQKVPYTDTEVRQLLKRPSPVADRAEWRSWAIVNLILGTAVRASTIIAMNIADLDLDQNLIMLRHNKNNKITSVLVTPKLKTVLKLYLRNRIDKEDEILFPNIYGERLTPSGLWQSIKRYNASRGISKTSVHLFKHTFGKMWANNGGDVYTLQRIMAHTDIRTTQKYINLYGDGSDMQKIVAFNPLETI